MQAAPAQWRYTIGVWGCSNPIRGIRGASKKGLVEVGSGNWVYSACITALGNLYKTKKSVCTDMHLTAT